MRKNKGASLVQYAIIIALIAIFLVPIFFLLGININNILTAFNNALKNNNDIITTNLINSGSTGPSTPPAIPAPVKSCSGGNCDIDFGDFVLTGIPEDFSTFIHDEGSSRGTDMLASLIAQMADNYENINGPDSAKELTEIVNLMKFVASIQAKVESFIPESGSISYYSYDKKLDETTMPLPDNLKDILTSYNTSSDMYSLIRDLGSSRLSLISDPSSAERRPEAAILTRLDQVISSGKYSQTEVATLKSILSQFNEVGSHMDGEITTAFFYMHSNPSKVHSVAQKDIMTGETINTIDHVYNTANVKHPDISFSSELTSALCSVAEGTDGC